MYVCKYKQKKSTMQTKRCFLSKKLQKNYQEASEKLFKIFSLNNLGMLLNMPPPRQAHNIPVLTRYCCHARP